MPKKYHIPTKTIAPRFRPVGKYSTIEFRENCAGSCKECVKKKCVYEIFKENMIHISAMKEPEYLYACQSCFRCVQECTRGIFSRVINPDYRTLGDSYWRPDIIHALWYQAHSGKVPVSGAGYRGPFAGPGFDSIWTDMSEIVRPTRDGIHGREYISTSVELSRRVTFLKFNEDKTIASSVPNILEIPMPMLFRLPEHLIINQDLILSAVKAAQALGTMMFIRPMDYTKGLGAFAENLIPCLTKDNYKEQIHLIQKSRAIEIAFEPESQQETENIVHEIKAKKPGIIIIARILLDAKAADVSLNLVKTDVDTLHFYADDHGNEQNAQKPGFLKDMIREIHLKLVKNQVRQNINLVFSGGIAMPEHVVKSLLCGADCVTLDNVLMVALECRLCRECQKHAPCPVCLDNKIDIQWARDRIINLMGSWHSQLLELMGAMGIREARRLRGEIGRCMWFEDNEGARDQICLIASGGIRNAMDVAKAIALGSDGVVIGTAELVALECVRCGNCESGRGCARGIATTDPRLGNMTTREYAEQRIVNMYMAWRKQWCELLRQLGMSSIKQLAGRSDLLVHLDYLNEEERAKYRPAPRYDMII